MKKYIALALALVCMLGLVGCGRLEALSIRKIDETGKSIADTEFEELDVDYTTNDDGTYTCRGNIYKYKIDVSGIEGDSQVTFIVLTNDTEISFENISHSLKKAEISTGVPEFVILGWY